MKTVSVLLLAMLCMGVVDIAPPRPHPLRPDLFRP